MSTKPDFSHQNPLYEIKQDDKLFTKLVSKETSIANPSFRSGVSVAVPFVWETQPGTPRHKLFPDPDSLPPTLTPPPSYYFTPTPNHENPATKKYSKSKLLNFLLLRIIHFKKGTQVTMSPSSPFSFSPSPSSSSSLSSYSSSSRSGNPSKIGRGRRRLLSMGSVYDDDDFQVSMTRSKSVLCFRS